jgi:hypothetical protein
MDALVERFSRTVEQWTSRRGFLGYLGQALVGGDDDPAAADQQRG